MSTQSHTWNLLGEWPMGYGTYGCGGRKSWHGESIVPVGTPPDAVRDAVFQAVSQDALPGLRLVEFELDGEAVAPGDQQGDKP